MRLSAPQNVFLNGLNTKFRAYVGGYGSGKTFVGCLDLLIFFAQHPGTRQGYFAPRYGDIRDTFYAAFDEAAHLMGFTVDIKETNKECHVYRNRRYYGTVICRSMDNPGSIVGFKIARALVDEIDTLTKDKARDAWNKIVARMRLVIPGFENGVGVTTTPEGFQFVYEKFALKPTRSYSMVQASTYENAEYLPPDYIPTLYETYTPELAQAYVDGLFVNLKSGTVYRQYDRQLHDSKETVRPGEPLYVGMDFNKNQMAACIFVKRDKEWHCVDEISGGIDTPYVCQLLQERYPGHAMTVYPDASGASGSSKGAAKSDISIINDAGFRVRARSANPRVADRVNSVNKAFQSAVVYVNAKACPESARCLEQQPYDKNGEPDKKQGLDHQVDAFGYFVDYEIPVRKPVTNLKIGFVN